MFMPSNEWEKQSCCLPYSIIALDELLRSDSAQPGPCSDEWPPTRSCDTSIVKEKKRRRGDRPDRRRAKWFITFVSTDAANTIYRQ